MRKQSFTNSKIGLDIANENDSWQQVAPYCEAPYWNEYGILEGVQVFNYEIAQNLVAKFNSNLKKLKDFFSGANGCIPFYNGHPDHSSAELRDMNVYAEADKLEARENGLWAHIIRKPELEQLKNELGKREISPRWSCKYSYENGRDCLVPTDLISFGLVDKGNLPNADVMNGFSHLRSYSASEIDAVKEIANMLGLEAETATVEAIKNEVKTMQTSLAETITGGKDLENKVKELTDKVSAKEQEIVNLSSLVNELKESLKVRGNELGAEKINRAFDEGKISVEQKDEFTKDFDNDFENAMKKFSEFMNASPKKNEDKEDKHKDDDKKDENEDEDEDKKKEGESAKQAKKAANGSNSWTEFWGRVKNIEKTRKVSRTEAVWIAQNSK